MTYRPDGQIVERVDPYPPAYVPVKYGPSPLQAIERGVEIIFGLIELLIVLRIVLLLVAARDANPIVAFVYSLSEMFVAPFRGILSLNQLQAGVTALDIGAIVALIGWLIIEFIILAVLRLFRPATAA